MGGGDEVMKKVSPIIQCSMPILLICIALTVQGGRHCSVDTSAPSILWSRVRIPSTSKFFPFMVYYTIFIMKKRTKINEKRPGLAKLKKQYRYCYTFISVNANELPHA